MQLLFSGKTCAILTSAVMFLCLSHRCYADSITLTSSALSSTTLGPSSDSISLNAGSVSFDSAAGSATFQTGDFIPGDSEIANQIIPFSFNDTIALNGVTEILNFLGQDDVTSTADTLSIFASTPTLFGNEVFTLQPFSATGYTIGQDLPIDLQATVSQANLAQANVAPTPEPNSLLLLGTGVLAVIFLAPKTRESLRSSPDAIAPRATFVPARSWVQRGANFHAAASAQAQTPTSTASNSPDEPVDRLDTGAKFDQNTP